MFGRVVVNKEELKIKEFDMYRSHYCGLCGELRKKGLFTALSLTYDLTFLSVLLNSLYEPCCNVKDKRCVCHICHKHRERSDEFTPYVADMNILLSYYKCLDDFHDDKNVIKLMYALYLKPKVNRIKKLYPEKCHNIKLYLEKLSLEEKTPSLEECANLFGNILGEVFTPKEDMWQDILYQMGFYLGKFIYIADAFSDLKEDIKKKRPNPLISMYSDDNAAKECEILMNMMAAECADKFEKLPLIENAEILRNIIYAGIWQNEGAVK